ncbi:MAG: hypothetical protein KQH53_05795 [Desulfarculaceae bacterium]|nr:hypothetical protein [Desulfarculaceae bacterium]
MSLSLPYNLGPFRLSGWPSKAGLAVLWVLALRLLLPGLGLPDSPATELAPLIGLDRPGFWWKFLATLAPLGLLGMSTAGHLLARWAGGAAAQTGPRLGARDWGAYLALPLLVACTALHAATHLWSLLAGAVYLAAIAYQAWLCAGLLWEAGAAPSAPRRLLAWGSALLGLALFWALAAWVVQAVSTCGDETIYLIDVDRLLAACGLSAGNAAQPAARLAFYWGGWSKALAAPLSEAWLLRLILAPGWLVAGRLGALAVLGLAGAVSLGLFCSLALSLGYRARVALAATWLLGFTLPLMQLTQHVYPGVFGVLGVVCGLVLLAGLPQRAGWRLAGLAGLGLALVLIKLRLAPAVLGLIMATVVSLYLELPRRRIWTGLGAALIGALGAAIILAAYWGVGPQALWRVGHELRNMPPLDLGLMSLTLPAMLLDQQFGIIAFAPWLLLGLAGAARFGRDNPRLFLYSLLAGGVAFLAVIAWRWLQWFGGFTPPGRFLAPLLPVLALWSLPALARAGRAWRVVLAWLGMLSLGLAFVFTLIPQWRFHRRTGMNNLLAWWGDQINGVVYHFLPSFNDHAWQPMLPAVIWLAFIAAAAVYLWREPRPGARSWSPRRAGLAAAGGLLAVVICLSLAGRVVSSGHLEAENLLTSQSRLYGDIYDQPVQLVLRSTKDVGRVRVVIPTGARGLDIKIVSHAGPPFDQPPPVLGVFLDGKELGRLPITGLKWSLVRLDAPLPPGVHTLELRMLSHNGRDVLGLDYLELR